MRPLPFKTVAWADLLKKVITPLAHGHWCIGRMRSLMHAVHISSSDQGITKLSSKLKTTNILDNIEVSLGSNVEVSREICELEISRYIGDNNNNANNTTYHNTTVEEGKKRRKSDFIGLLVRMVETPQKLVS